MRMISPTHFPKTETSPMTISLLFTVLSFPSSFPRISKYVPCRERSTHISPHCCRGCPPTRSHERNLSPARSLVAPLERVPAMHRPRAQPLPGRLRHVRETQAPWHVCPSHARSVVLSQRFLFPGCKNSPFRCGRRGIVLPGQRL